MFYFSLALGIGSVFVTIIGEKLPLRKRNLTMPAILVAMEICEAAQNFLLPLLVTQFGVAALALLFIMYGVSNLCSAFVAHIWLD